MGEPSRRVFIGKADGRRVCNASTGYSRGVGGCEVKFRIARSDMESYIDGAKFVVGDRDIPTGRINLETGRPTPEGKNKDVFCNGGAPNPTTGAKELVESGRTNQSMGSIGDIGK